jgi:hypothetical protein
MITQLKAQTGLYFKLGNDSTINALKSEIISIYKEYGVNDNTYKKKLPDTLAKKVESAFLLLTKREEVLLTEYFLENAEFIYREPNDKLLLSDSFDVMLKSLKIEITNNFGYNSNRYPTQLINSIDRINYLLERRKSLTLNQKLSSYEIKEDSIIQSNKIVLKGFTKLGFGTGTNQNFLSAQYAFVLGHYKKAYFGIGSGLEQVSLNKDSGSVSLLQAPVYLANYIYLGKMVYINFDYGLTVPLSASYKNFNDKKIDFKESELRNNFYLDFGIGLQVFELALQLNFRNQSLGIPDDLNQRAWMFGFKIKF